MKKKRVRKMIEDTSGRDYLKALREKHGFSQLEFAKEVGLGSSTIKNIEALKTPLTPYVRNMLNLYEETHVPGKMPLEDYLYEYMLKRIEEKEEEARKEYNTAQNRNVGIKTEYRPKTEEEILREQRWLGLLAHKAAKILNHNLATYPEGIGFLVEYMSEADILCDAADYCLKRKYPLMVQTSAEHVIPRVRTYVDRVAENANITNKQKN